MFNLTIKKEVIPKLKKLWGVRHISLFGENHLETKVQYDRKKISNANISPPDFMANVSRYLEVSHPESNQKIVNPIPKIIMNIRFKLSLLTLEIVISLNHLYALIKKETKID
jgi:hypothetical protein